MQAIDKAQGAVELLGKGLRPTCVLLDLNLPAQACGELLDRVLRAKRATPFALILSSGRFELSAWARQCHTKWTLPKPYGLEELVRTVQEASDEFSLPLEKEA